MLVAVGGALSMIDLSVCESIDFTLGNDFSQVVRGLTVVGGFGVGFVVSVLIFCCFRYSRGICNVRLNVMALSGVNSWPVMYSFPWKLLCILAFKSAVDGCSLNALSLASVSWSGLAIVNVKWFSGDIVWSDVVYVNGVMVYYVL